MHMLCMGGTLIGFSLKHIITGVECRYVTFVGWDFLLIAGVEAGKLWLDLSIVVHLSSLGQEIHISRIP